MILSNSCFLLRNIASIYFSVSLRVIHGSRQSMPPIVERRRYGGSMSSWKNLVVVLINNRYLSRQGERKTSHSI
ncbi:MAG: hypothetical protein ACJ71E_11605 [Nitrososphaeraceae archaeon]